MRMNRLENAGIRQSILRNAEAILLAFMLCVSIVMAMGNPVYASDVSDSVNDPDAGWVRDGAQLLSDSEEESLEEKSQQICEQYGISVVIVTTERYEGYDILDWERALYASQSLGVGENQSCLMFGVSMAERDWGITAYGDAETIFGAYSRETIGGAVLDDLSDGNYYKAFDRYLDLSEEFMEDAENGEIYSASNPYRAKWNIGLIIIGSFVVSMVVSLLVVLSWKRKMNTKVLQKGAGAYLKGGKAALTKRSDIYLYRTVSKTRRQKSNSGGSGGMHSSGNGTRGKF